MLIPKLMASNLNYRYCFFVKQLTVPYLRFRRRSVHGSAELNCQQDQGSENESGSLTIMELRSQFMKMRGVKPGFTQVTEDRTYLLQYLPKTQEELPPRSVKDSFQSAVIPLSSHPQLQERYVNVIGTVRFGRLLEDLDMFSDWIAMNYIRNPKQPKDEITSYNMVTVLVDHITCTDYVPRAGLDIRITGHVSGVGKTTVETTVWMDQNAQGVYHRITKAIFLMAARNAVLSGGAIVNPLVPASEEEKIIIARGEARKQGRISQDRGSFLAQMPSPEEQRLVHKLFVESIDTTVARRVLPPSSVWMADTKRTNNIFSFSEDRNFHNTVFGGFLMRHAVEMAWFTGYFYCKHRVRLRSISDILFKHPVPLGSIISFHGQVVYTEGNLMQIFVHGDVNSPLEAQNVTSIFFYFTYESPEPIKCVKPNTYYEAMMYIDGRRHFMDEMNRHYKKA